MFRRPVVSRQCLRLWRENCVWNWAYERASARCYSVSAPGEQVIESISKRARRGRVQVESQVTPGTQSIAIGEGQPAPRPGACPSTEDGTAVEPSFISSGKSMTENAHQHSANRRASRSNVAILSTPRDHTTLAEYLDYADRKALNKSSQTFRGTVYEYKVMEALERYGFWLRRIGARDDLGIDLLGHWYLPAERELNVLVQCKHSKPTPSMVRELEGAYVGAPARWRGDDCMAVLIASQPATLGVRDALQRSQMPMGFAQITSTGEMQQFLWNHAAAEARLTGLSTTAEYRTSVKTSGNLAISDVSKAACGEDGPNSKPVISLLWLGKQWKDKPKRHERVARLRRLDYAAINH